MSNLFKIGDKVKFKDNELNRAECALCIDKTLTVEHVHIDGLLKLRENEKAIHLYHYSRFELVPQYAVGQYVKFSTHNGNGYGIIVGKTGNRWNISALDRYQFRWHLCEYDFAAVLPSEVIIDFGNGIKGTIERVKSFPHKIRVIYGSYSRGDFHVIAIDQLTDPMKTIVIDLLKAQAREGK